MADQVRFQDYLNNLSGTQGAEVARALLNSLIGRMPKLDVAFTGAVATGVRCMSAQFASFAQMLSRSPHYAHDDITSLQVVLGAWFLTAGAGNDERAAGDTTHSTTYVEYPAGTFTQVFFSASPSVVIPSGTTIVSDRCAVTIPRGALFWIRTRQTNPAGFIATASGLNIYSGAKIEYAASGLTDAQLLTNFSSHAGMTTSVGQQFMPLAIIGTTRERSFFLVGDSIVAGNSDVWEASADSGILRRSVGVFAPYIDVSVGADRLDFFVAQHTLRMALAVYCSDFILSMGVNDFTNGQTDAQMLANERLIAGYMPANIFKKSIATITPVATSSDAFATTANQTATATNGVRATVNERRIGSHIGYDAVLDMANVVEAGRGSGIWSVVNGVPTADGTHPNQATYLRLKNSGVITPLGMA